MLVAQNLASGLNHFPLGLVERAFDLVLGAVARHDVNEPLLWRMIMRQSRAWRKGMHKVPRTFSEHVLGSLVCVWRRSPGNNGTRRDVWLNVVWWALKLGALALALVVCACGVVGCLGFLS